MILFTIIILTITVILFVNFAPVFGNNSKGASKTIIENSPNYIDGKFQNLVPTKMDFRKGEDYNSEYIATANIGKRPKRPLPSVKFNKANFAENDANSITWFGHSIILFKLEKRIIIVDPVFNNASPFSAILGPKPFKYENNICAKNLPNNIDVVLITHDHYDHLEYKTIKEIHSKVDKFLVPLGNKAHLMKWGVPDSKIEEFDWYDNFSYGNIDFTFTPTRHFSGRALRDRFASLWGGWIIKSISNNFYISGDGGYSDEFKVIGNKYGPFDIVFIENGAYNPRWENIHLFPEQGVQASLDAQAKIALPIHWGKFSLSSHSWSEPIDRFAKEAEKRNLTIATPLFGQTFIIGGNIPNENWWNNFQ
ncbi:MBL fold metallo-hydrolase [bacterium]|nr:MBL fold metallo-hydrolase [bacterium]